MKLLRRVLLCLSLFALAAGSVNAFVIQDSAGNALKLESYRGKWVVVNFWAPWCPPCIEEIPDLVQAFDARRDADLMVIGVALDYESRQEVMRLAQSLLVSYPVVLDQKAVKAQFGLVKGLPASWIYDPEGRLVKKHLGKLSSAQLAHLTSR